MPRVQRRPDKSGHPSKLGAAIAGIRRERGLLQKDVAKRAEIAPAYLSQIESGDRSPSRETLERLGAALGVSPETIRSRSGKAGETGSGRPTAPFSADWRERLAGVVVPGDQPAVPDVEESEAKRAGGELLAAARGVVASKRATVSLAERLKYELQTGRLVCAYSQELQALANGLVDSALGEGAVIDEATTLWVAALFLHCLAPGDDPGAPVLYPDETLVAFVVEMLRDELSRFHDASTDDGTEQV